MLTTAWMILKTGLYITGSVRSAVETTLWTQRVGKEIWKRIPFKKRKREKLVVESTQKKL